MIRDGYSLALRFLGLKETPGAAYNPAVLSMLQLVDASVHDDETAWCSAFVHYVAFLMDVQRARSLGARHWLTVGLPIALEDARPGWDVVVLSRGAGVQPPANIIDAPGHVAWFSQLLAPDAVRLLGGNQGNMVSLETFPRARVLGVRRLV